MSQTPIYIDERGRRRRDNKRLEPVADRFQALEADMAVLRTEGAAEKAVNAQQEAKIAQLSTDLYGMQIQGDGIDFDGEGPRGITGRLSIPEGAAGSGAPVGQEQKNTIISDNGTLNYYLIPATFNGAV